jgi:Ser/Thr protein kinase RdoA (MazF antagonist)
MSAEAIRDDADGGRRGRRPELTSSLICSLQAHYGLPEPTFLADLGGSVHLNLQWASDGHLAVVRVYRAHVSQPRLEAIQQARLVLAGGGVPTARIVESRAGLPFVAVDRHLAEVEEYVEFDAIMDDWDRLATGLPLLGRVHCLLAELNADGAGADAPFANYISRSDALAGTRRGTARIRSWRPTAAEAAIADAADRLAGLVSDAEDRAPSLPHQLVHGDFWHNNVCFLGGVPVLVADLDFMGSRSRVDDLALVLYFALCEVPRHDLSTVGLGHVVSLARAYETGLDEDLTADERAALPLAMARQPLWSIGGWVARLDDDAAARAHAAGCGQELEAGLVIMTDLGRWQAALS